MMRHVTVTSDLPVWDTGDAPIFIAQTLISVLTES
jgi:hypothetical protein